MKTHPRLGSLFDGIGGFPLVASWYGIEAVQASEIEPIPISITKRHFPHMLHLGDVTKINGAEIEPVDVLTFGSPCTRLSVAGNHDGFGIAFVCYEDEEAEEPHFVHEIRATDKFQYAYTMTCPVCGKELTETNESALFFHAIRIITEMREATHGKHPRIIVWENVPGAFSSNKGEDFRKVIEEICGIAEPGICIPGYSNGWPNAGLIMGNGFSAGWRILDAQFWGVPQRRKRIYFVADLGGGSAAEILFKPESLRRHTTPSGAPWKRFAGGVETGVNPAIARSLTARNDGSPCIDRGPEVVVQNIYNESGHGYWMPGCGCLRAQGESRPSRPSHVVAQSMLMSDPNTAVMMRMRSGCDGGGKGALLSEDMALTLKQGNDQVLFTAFACNQRDEARDLGDKSAALQAQPGMKQQTFVVAFCAGQAAAAGGIGYAEEQSPTLRTNAGGNTVPAVLCMATGQAGAEITEDISPTLNCNHEQPIVAGLDCRNSTENGDLCGTLQAKPGGGYSLNFTHPVRIGLAVRRLIPLETDRLQGYPDDWTRWGHDGKEISDTARYKADGNSVATPCVDYIMSGIADVLFGVNGGTAAERG